jgi:gliding motility-associated-like protein
VLQEPAVFGVDLQLIGPLACDAGWGIRINEFIGGIPPFSFKIDTTDAFQSLGSLPFELLDLTAGNYSLQFEDAMGCPVTVIVPVPERNPVRDLVMDLGFDTNVQRGQGVVIDPLVNFNPVSVSWMPETAVENPNLLSTTIRPVQTTLYTATVTDENGCSVSDSILIRVIQDEKIFIPSAFSPNNDGINDRFVLFPGPEVREIRSVRIFDRWGTLVFEGSGLPDEQNAWDGSLPNRRPAGAGIYLYFLEMLDQNGVEEIIRGSLTLIR